MSVIFASKAVVDKEYKTTTPNPNFVKMLGVAGNKVKLAVNVPGYGYKNATPMLVEPSFLLAEIAGGEKMKTASKKEVKSESKIEKLPKVGKGKAAARVKIETFTLREFYRARLHENRAAECQAAVHKVCNCRCGGVLHGKSHKDWKRMEDELFDVSGHMTAKQVLGLIKHFSK